jgi:phytoene dehydrogenase-like protein
MARFGLAALLPAATLARVAFRGDRARAVLAGMTSHAMMPLSTPATAAFGLVLGLVAHAIGWPMARGGSQRIADALGAHLRSLRGEIVTGHPVRSRADLPDARAILFDTSPRQLVQVLGKELPSG